MATNGHPLNLHCSRYEMFTELKDEEEDQMHSRLEFVCKKCLLCYRMMDDIGGYSETFAG